MAINLIDYATVARSQDISIIKHNDDVKSMHQQSTMVDQSRKDNAQKHSEVNRQENADWHQQGFDARDKGKNQYAGDGGKSRRKNKQVEQVVVNGRKSFDIKI